MFRYGQRAEELQNGNEAIIKLRSLIRLQYGTNVTGSGASPEAYYFCD
jgi:hypothetical protein